jgi:hypothetical protein
MNSYHVLLITYFDFSQDSKYKAYTNLTHVLLPFIFQIGNSLSDIVHMLTVAQAS